MNASRRLTLMCPLLLGLSGCANFFEFKPYPPDPPVSPVVYEPVAAWWHYFPDMSDSEWDYFTQVRRGADPVLMQFHPSEHPEYFRVRQTNESAVHAYNQRRQSQQGGVRTPRVQAREIPIQPMAARPPPPPQRAKEVGGLSGASSPEVALIQGHNKISSPRFSIRMGQFETDQEAEEVKQRLWALGFNSFKRTSDTEGGKGMIVVNAGPYGERREAEEAMAQLKAKIRRVEGGDTFPVEVVPYTP